MLFVVEAMVAACYWMFQTGGRAGAEMFGDQIHLQISLNFPIGQSPSALALFAVSGQKVPVFHAWGLKGPIA